MNIKQPVKKAAMSVTLAGIVGLGTLGLNHQTFPLQQADAAAKSSVAKTNSYASEHALQTLMSFYKPALKGQFPGVVSGLTVGTSTEQDVTKAIGGPTVPRKTVSGFDLYGADMGNPGYAFSYSQNKLQEMRYFGTNVERQTNIGGITTDMVWKNWYAPSSVTTFKTGKIMQTKLTYVRGDFKLEFIFNSSTDLDHINLTKK